MMAKRNDRTAAATKAKDGMDLTSMIDVTFLLLIFFICTLEYKKLEGKLTAYLPSEFGSDMRPVVPLEKLEIRVDVIDEGEKVAPGTGDVATAAPYVPGVHARYRFRERRFNIKIGVESFSSDDLDDVAERLNQLAAIDADRPVAIDPRRGVVTDDVVQVLDLVLDAQFTKISFAGSHEN
jgi:biopolymer transport protein ExbD